MMNTCLASSTFGMKTSKRPVNSPRRRGMGSTIAVAMAWALGSASASPAADQVWNTAGPTDNWNTTDLNWDGGVVWVNNNNAIFGGAPETVTVTEAGVTFNDITFNSNYIIANGPGSLSLANDAASQITVANGVTATIAESMANGIGGATSLTKTGAGTLVLSSANSYSGGTTISQGVLSISAANQLGTGTILLNGGTLRSTGGANTDINTATALTVGAAGGTINSVQTAGTFRFQQANSLLGSGPLTITGNGTLPLAGTPFAGVVVLNASNTYSGNVIVQNGGLLEYAAGNGLGAGATVTVNDQGGFSVAGQTISHSIQVNNAGTLAFQNNNNGVFAGPISINGNVSVRLQDWYGTTLRNGAISNTISGSGTVNVNSGSGGAATLTLRGFDAMASSAGLVLSNAHLVVDSSQGTAAASVTRGNSLTINNGNLTINGVASQNTNDVFGTLNLAGGSATSVTGGLLPGYSTWQLNPNAATNARLTFTNMGNRTPGSWVAINGTVGNTPGAGTGNIYFTNVPTGANFVGAGGSLASGTASVIPWLRDTSGGAIYGYDATVGVAPVTTVNVNPNSATAGQNINWNAAATLTADRTINSFQAAFSNVDFGGNTLTVNSGVITADNATFHNGTLDFGTAEGQLSVHQVRTLNINTSITGSAGLTFVGFSVGSAKGSLILGGANTYTGVTNFFGYGPSTAAALRLTHSLALQNTTLNHVAGRGNDLVFGNGGTSGQTAYTFGGLTGNAGINLTNNNTTPAAVALTIGSAGTADTASTVNVYSGVLSNSVAGGSIIKAGVATQVFSGNNTYTGGTTINGGTLLANTAVSGTNSATGTGPVNVNAGGTLGGIGQIYPTGANGITVASGGTIAPGASIGTLTINLGGTSGIVTIASGGGFKFELGTAGASLASVGTSDLLALTGASAGDVAFNDNVVNFLGTGQVGYYKLFDTTHDATTWTGLTFDGTTGVVSAGLSATNLAGGLMGTFIVGTASNGADSIGDIYLELAVIPEPAALALVALGLLCLLPRRRSQTTSR
jgi:fibronectin-binding autotransporter adhesin